MQDAEERKHAPSETEGIGGLGMWTLGAMAGFFLAFWLGFIVLLGGSGSDEPVLSGSGESPVAPAAVDGIVVTATEFAFDPVPSTTPSGQIGLTLRNEGLVFHNLEILTTSGERVPDFILEAAAGREDAGNANLTAGSYLLICSIPGHREAGMEATLTVTG